jgi:hypothetical protein
MNGYLRILQVNNFPNRECTIVMTHDLDGKVRFWSKRVASLAGPRIWKKMRALRSLPPTLDDISQCCRVEGCGPPNSAHCIRDNQQYSGLMHQERCALNRIECFACSSISALTSARRSTTQHYNPASAFTLTAHAVFYCADNIACSSRPYPEPPV